jgi:hypothetical protein
METSVCWKIVETLNIWHILHCNLLDWEWKSQNKKRICKKFGYLCSGSKLPTLFHIAHSKSSCKETKWYPMTLTILIHCNTSYF